MNTWQTEVLFSHPPSLSLSLSLSVSLCFWFSAGLRAQNGRHVTGWSQDPLGSASQPTPSVSLPQNPPGWLSVSSTRSCLLIIHWSPDAMISLWPAVYNNAESRCASRGTCLIRSGCGRGMLANVWGGETSKRRQDVLERFWWSRMPSLHRTLNTAAVNINRSFHHVSISGYDISRATAVRRKCPISPLVRNPWHRSCIQTSLWQLWGAGVGKTGKMEEIKSLWQIWQPPDDFLLSVKEAGNSIPVSQCHKNEGSQRQMGGKLKKDRRDLARSRAVRICQNSFNTPR